MLLNVAPPCNISPGCAQADRTVREKGLFNSPFNNHHMKNSNHKIK